MTNTQQNTHYTSETNPTYVTHSEWYRLAGVLLLTPDRPDFAELESVFLPEFRRPEGYGMAFLESEEHTRMYLGSVEQIRAVAAGEVALDVTQGITGDKWPHENGWDKVTPSGTWNPDGKGVLTVHPHPNGVDEVIVYEFHGAYLREDPTPKVTFHCTACHLDTRHSGGDMHENTDPDMRRWAGRQARSHMRSAERHGVGGTESACRPLGQHALNVVAEVANSIHGTSHKPMTESQHCAISGPCSTIREIKALQAARSTNGTA